MWKRLLICLALLGVLLALPLLLRPAAPAGAAAAPAGRDRLVIITAHNKAIRDEYEHAFRRYYLERTGRDIELDFRTPGGTSDIVRYIADRFKAEFRRYCESHPDRIAWSEEIAGAVFNPRTDTDPEVSDEARRARRLFLESDVGIDIDLFAGGGTFDHARQAAAGFAVDGGVARRHPEYLRSESIPASFGGDALYDPQGRYYGVVLSTFGICANQDRIAELPDPRPPETWADLGDPRFFNLIAVADPSKSGSANKCFEIVLQQCMSEAGSPEAGWAPGLNLIKRIFANTRNVADAASGAVREVSAGNAAAGMAIDTYGFSEIAWIKQQNDGRSWLNYVTPRGGTAVSADPVQLLRGAPNRAAAEIFIDFLLSEEGQKLHVYKVGAPGGPVKRALNRPAIRRELYAESSRPYRFEPDYNPYRSGADFVYHAAWTARYYNLLRVLIKCIALDPHPELQQAWQAIIAAGGPDKVPQAMAAFNALPFDYAGAAEAAEALRVTPENPPAAVAAALRGWSEFARRQYLEAARLAQEGK